MEEEGGGRRRQQQQQLGDAIINIILLLPQFQHHTWKAVATLKSFLQKSQRIDFPRN